jgi:DNA-binding NtrC family response regulator
MMDTSPAMTPIAAFRPCPGSAPKRIAIVDDEPVIRSLLERLLKIAGYETASYPNGETALAACQREAFDLVITDLRMPGIDGFELMENLKSQRPSLPVIVLTAHGDVDNAIRALRRRACDFITKPFDTCNILNSIRRVIERSSRADN